MKVMSSREFNQDVSQAKRAAQVAPVFVTDRGRPTHVLMSMEAFRRMSGTRETIVDLLAMRDVGHDSGREADPGSADDVGPARGDSPWGDPG